MTKKFALLIVAAMGLAAPAYAQSVRVITGDIEHVYGPGGQILDDEALQRQNERRENARLEMQRQSEITRRQEELLATEQARQSAQAAPVYYESGSYGFIAGRRVRSSQHGQTSGRRH
jgi:hypothetical protein